MTRDERIEAMAGQVWLVWGVDPEAWQLLAILSVEGEADKLIEMLREHESKRPENKHSGTFDWDERDQRAFLRWQKKEVVSGSWAYHEFKKEAATVHSTADAIVRRVCGE